MPIRVLHVINGEYYSGAERVQDLLACRLPEYGYACDFFCLKAGAFGANRMATHSTVHERPMTSRFDLSVVRSLVSVLNGGRYRLMHTHTARGAAIGRLAAAWTRTPFVHHVHSPTRLDTEHHVRNRINAFVEERLVFPGASRLIAVSNSLKQYLIDVGVDANRIEVVHNGVPTIARARPWQPPESEWVVGTVALFRPRKGLEVLLSAVAHLRQRELPVRLRVIGGFVTSDYREAIVARARELGLQDHIDWTGFTREVSHELSECSIFALPSLYGEGLPMVLIEAMALGIPVVASGVDGVSEVIADGSSGVVVAPGDPLALADGIESVIRLRPGAADLAESGRRRQQQSFSDSSMARAVAGVYSEILGIELPSSPEDGHSRDRIPARNATSGSA